MRTRSVLRQFAGNSTSSTSISGLFTHRLPSRRPFTAMACSSASASAPPAAAPPSQTPMADAIRAKLTEAFAPSTLEIYNDSHLHAHHKPMQGSTSSETHFRLVITADAFKAKPQPARHRMVYALLKDEMAQEGGIHALQLRTRTPEEEGRARQQEAAASS
jgi:BolA-like protein 1